MDNALYHQGKRVPLGTSDDQSLGAARVPCDPGDFQWIGVHDPSPDELQLIARTFDLHPLAVEDAGDSHQRPKLERYDDGIFLVLKTLWYVDEEDAVETGEINLFVGRDFVVSVRHGEGTELSSTRLGLEGREAVLGHGPSSVVYAIVDRVVDTYEEVVGQLEIDVDEVEASVFSPQRTQDSRRIYILKRELSEVRRAVNPLKEPMKRFATGSVPAVTQEAAPFFRDVADHLTRVSEAAESLDGLLSTAFDAHLARISVEQNEDMRKISAWVAIAAVGTLVAGIYGMNFTHMPELHWRLGYPFALALMVVASIVLYRWFKKSGWL